ncbi:hypothetical protein PALB_15210 [Pseudoalteromonas luteoviolacea B = ATCC 29581]|nr:hypothetical protein PALB_15210 [Pseudoalteromonas luteoviolacea B = ATCC 29581]
MSKVSNRLTELQVSCTVVDEMQFNGKPSERREAISASRFLPKLYFVTMGLKRL